MISTSSSEQIRPLRNAIKVSPWKRWYYQHENGVLGWIGILALLIIWEIVGRSGMINPLFISSPTRIWSAGVMYLETGRFWNDLSVSGTQFLLGFFLAIAVGIPFGLLMGWYKKINGLLDPLVTFLYASPRIALMPLFIIWFGIGIGSKVAIIFLGAVFPIVINTLIGIRTIDPLLLNVARSHKAKDHQIFATIVLPSAVPAIITGIRLGLGHALIGIVVGEMSAATAGIGFRMTQAGASYQTDLVFFALFLISGSGLLFSVMLRRLERRFDKWRAEVIK